MSDSHESPNLEDLTPEEANRIIHSHRKVRYGKWVLLSYSSLPCHHHQVLYAHCPQPSPRFPYPPGSGPSNPVQKSVTIT